MGIMNMVDHELSRMTTLDAGTYAEARLTKPETVTMESNPLTFYRHSLSDVSKTTSLLASYWKHRKTLFGDNAFLPLLDLHKKRFGDAVASSDVAVLKSEFVQLLPSDSRGRRVLFINPSQRGSLSEVSLKRATFLVLQSMIGDSERTSDDLVLILFISGVYNEDDVDFLGWLCDMVANSMPLSLTKLHLIKAFDCILPDRVFPALDRLVRLGLVDEIAFSSPTGPADLLQRMKQHSLSPHILPTGVGGEFTWDPNSLLVNDSSSEMKVRAISRGETIEPSIRLGLGTDEATLGIFGLDQMSEDTKLGSEASSQEGVVDSLGGQPGRQRSRNAIYSRRK